MPKQTQTQMLKEIKGYLRIDNDYEDELLKMLRAAAEDYMTNAGIVADDNPLYRLAIMLYVAAQYENRDGSQKSDGFSHSLQSIILQLKG